MNGRILGNRHVLVEISAETRENLNVKEEKEVICDANDRLLRKEYPSVRRRSVPDNQEDFIQSKLLQSLAKLKSDQASVVSAGCKDSEESNGPSFLDKLEEILKKVMKEFPGETTTRPTADEGPVCTITLEDMRQDSLEASKNTQSLESPPMNGVNHSPINSEHSFVKPVDTSVAFVPGPIGLDNGFTQSPGSPPMNGNNHSPINSEHYAKPVDNSITFLPKSKGLDMRQDTWQNSLETPKSTRSVRSPPMNGEHSFVKPVDTSVAFVPESIGLDNGFPESQSEQSMHIKSAIFPVETWKADTHSSSALPLTKSTLSGDDLRLQELKISERQNHDTNSSSLDPYVLSKMRDIPCQDVRCRSQETSPIVQSRKSPVAKQVSPVSRTGEDLINVNGSHQEGWFRSEPSPIVHSERLPIANQVSCVSRTAEALINSDGINEEMRNHETSPIGHSERSPLTNQVSRESRTEELLINSDGTNEGIRNLKTSPIGHSERSPLTNQVSRESRTGEALINSDGTNEEMRNHETSPIGQSERSPVANRVSLMSRTYAAMEAQLKAHTPSSSKDNDSPIISSFNSQRQTSSSTVKENIKATNGNSGHGLSFQEQISHIDDGSGRDPKDTQHLAPDNVMTSTEITQDSTRRRQHSHNGENTELKGREVSFSSLDEERGDDTRMLVQTHESNGHKLCETDSLNEEKDEDRKDMEGISPQRTPDLEQYQPKYQQEQLPLQQEHLSFKQRSVHDLQLKLGEIIKENERLHSALPEHYKDKNTSGMYPDKEMLNLEESIHIYEVEYQREMEVAVARNAEHELLYEREKLSAAFDTNLQKELDLELQMEMMKNEIKLANMANQLLTFYQKRNDMQ
ncbi:uncharacterized protein LOC116297555 isoform X2 [Actinia tenebrosa]|nr:uncharacterized protein LOC116297555 isoform X2 [Actinia tenebrosa]